MSFGSIRAVVGTESAMIFDAHNLDIQHFAKSLSDSIQGQDFNGVREHDQPFELRFLEEVLQETCDSFSRRVRLYEPIVDQFLGRVANEVFSDSGVHQLVPLKDSLQGFEILVKQSLQCLTDLLNNDEDMLALLITEQSEAQSKGLEVDYSEHDDVELMLEEYARQLNNILYEINFLLQRLQSKQEFVQLALAGYRNRLIRMELYLGIGGISLGIGTTVAGYFGMNLTHGLEENAVAFPLVVLGTGILGMTVAVACTNYVSGNTMQRRAEERMKEIGVLTSALSDMGALDFTVRNLLDKGEPLTRDNFRTKLRKARKSGDVTDEEIDLLFNAMDIQRDGMLRHDDFKNIQIDRLSRENLTRETS